MKSNKRIETVFLWQLADGERGLCCRTTVKLIYAKGSQCSKAHCVCDDRRHDWVIRIG